MTKVDGLPDAGPSHASTTVDPLTNDRRLSGAPGSAAGVGDGDGASPPDGVGSVDGDGEGAGVGDSGGGGRGGGGGAGGGGGGGGDVVTTRAACDTTIDCPPTLTRPVRSAPPLGATVMITVSEPLPLPGGPNVIQSLVVCATHEQPEPSFTSIVAAPPLAVHDDNDADARSRRRRARQMFAVAAPRGLCDEKSTVWVSALTAGWPSAPRELIAAKFPAPLNGAAGVSRAANQMSVPPRPPGRS